MNNNQENTRQEDQEDIEDAVIIDADQVTDKNTGEDNSQGTGSDKNTTKGDSGENNKKTESHTIDQGKKEEESNQQHHAIERQSSVIDTNQTPNNAVDTSAASISLIGYAIIFLVFGALLGWAFWAPLSSASYAPGVVTVENYRKTIQHLEGGIVRELHVKDGSVVNKGDVLIVLDDTQLKAQLEIAKSQYVTYLALQGRLQAERDGRQEIIFDDYLQQKRTQPAIAQAIKLQQQIFVTRQAAKQGEIDVSKQQIEDLNQQIKGLMALEKNIKKEIKLYKEEIAELQALLKEGYTDKSRMREMQRRVAELEGELTKNNSSITVAKIRIGEEQLKILQIEKKFQMDVVQKLSENSAKINDLKERIIAIKDKITRTRILAPESGMVLGMAIHTIGGVISPGKPILEIVPQTGKLIIEAQVPPNDIDVVHKGLTSEIRFSAFTSAKMPIIDGVVTYVSPDRLIDKKTGHSYYLARVKIKPESAEKIKDLTLKPGMPASVLIKTGERTVFQYLVQPISNIFARSFNED